jgi:aspartyl-tRNA(Asn)/glutamyl-tRNA(Gln) amidotransferase subunit A
MNKKFNPISTIEYLCEAIKFGNISVVDLVKYYVARIEKFNPILNSFITITKEQALEDAHVMQDELRKGNYLGPLHGIPFSIKDNISAKNIRSTKGSQIFSNNNSTSDSTVVKRLRKAGAILLGKNNLNEFASGIDGKNIFFGIFLPKILYERYSIDIIYQFVGNEISLWNVSKKCSNVFF